MQNYSRNRLNHGYISKWYSWPVIIVFLFLCFPVAIFLIYRRLKVVPGAGKGSIIVGAVFLIFALSLAEGNAKTSDYPAAVFGLILGLLLVYWGVKAIRNWKKYDRYDEIVLSESDETVDSEEEEYAEEPPKQAGSSVIRCPNCGANNTVTSGSTGVCEYCGAAIQA